MLYLSAGAGSGRVDEHPTVAVMRTERPPRITVVLALRSPVQRLGVEHMVRAVDMVRSCRSYDTVAAAVAEARAQRPTVLIVALRELDAAAGALLSDVTRHGVQLLVLVDDDLTQLSRLAGIRGIGMVSLEELSVSNLRTALVRLQNGETPIPPQVAYFLVAVAGAKYEAGQSGARVRITHREQEVLVLLVDGLSNKQIARRLGISVHGAKRHVANVLAKLDCPNRTLAVAKALREGLYEECANRS